MLSEFRAFLVQTNALALAIGVIIGVALGNVVNSLVADIIMPPVASVIGRVDFSQLSIPLGESGVAIRYGAFLTTVLVFVIVAFVVFMIARAMIKPQPVDEPVAAKNCPFCFEAVRIEATRCSHCASDLAGA